MFVNIGIVAYLVSRKYSLSASPKRRPTPVEFHTDHATRNPTCDKPSTLPVYVCMHTPPQPRRSSRSIDQRRFLQRWLKYMHKSLYKIHVLVPRSQASIMRDDLCAEMNRQDCSIDIIDGSCLQHSTNAAILHSKCIQNYLLVDSRLAIDASFSVWLQRLDTKTISCLVIPSHDNANACNQVGYWIPSQFTALSNNVTAEAERQHIPINYNPISVIPA